MLMTNRRLRLLEEVRLEGLPRKEDGGEGI